MAPECCMYSLLERVKCLQDRDLHDHCVDRKWLHRHWHNGWEGTEYRDLLQAFRDEVATDSAALPHIIWKEMVATHYRSAPYHNTHVILLLGFC